MLAEDEDRVPPTEADRVRNRKLMDDVGSGKVKLPTYSTDDLKPRPVGPQSDADFEPRRSKTRSYSSGGIVRDPARGGKVLNTKSWRK